MIRPAQIALFFGLILAQSLAFGARSACEEIRAGIDIGSGTTKMVVARVDACTQSILETLAPAPGGRLPDRDHLFPGREALESRGVEVVDGMPVTVDGDAGVVVVHEEAVA